ncbi:MAG: Na(+)-translocating NADH-quinone reductase subunit C [Planctomycetota bacterium]
MSNDRVLKIVLVATLLCVVCSVLVSTAAVVLRPMQEKNSQLDMRRNILEAAQLIEPGEEVDVEALFENIEVRVIDMNTGEEAEGIDPAEYDPRKAAKDPKLGEPVPPDEDLAEIKRRALYQKVYLHRNESGELDKVILPIHGLGLWSTLYGFIALEPDLKTVQGLVYYDHKETPGLGGEVDNPKWKAQWPGKVLFDDDGNYDFTVHKGPSPVQSVHDADGVSGATITLRGVDSMLRYWMGENGYGPFLDNLKKKIDG